MSCWIRLGIEPTNDPDVIRGAYRALLPQHHPETDPQGFQALREAYEHALRLARDEQDEIPEFPEHDEPRPARNALIEQTMSDFAKLLADPSRRFEPPAWQAFIDGFSTLTLGDQEQVSWHLMYKLMETGPLSHACAQLMARHLGWENEVLRLEDPRQADEFLERISEPDPFDTRVMKHWSAEAQVEALWYARNLDYLYHTRPLFEFESFVTLHTCVPLPDDQAYIHSLLVKLCQAGIGSPTFFAMVAEQQRQAPDDIDLLYMLACQASDTDQEELARQCWTRLWREHQHPEAGRWLLNLCAQHQPQRLPLLIQALDRLEPVHVWPQDLSDPAQIWGSPSQRPETLTRWFEAARDEHPGIAGEFIKWRLDGKDELPLLAWLLDDQPDRQLHRLYRHAWALHRGDSGLLRQILDEPLGDDPLDLLIIEGFKYQAEQQLRWLEQSPLALALTAFINSPSAQPQLPEVLRDGAGLSVARDWLRRVRSYPAATLPKLTALIKPANLMPTPFAVQLLSDLAEAGIELPRPPADDGLWTWHRQSLYMLALVEQPERWLGMAPVQLLASLPYPAEHPFSGLQQLLLQLRQQQGNADGLLGWLDDNDPLQAFIGERLLTVQQALDSSKLPSNLKLYACLENDPRAFDDDVLGLMVLCGVLYHDPSLSAEQHGSLLRRISTMTCPDAWFEPFRSGLIKGEPVRPPRKVLEEDELINSTLFYSMLDTLKDLARYGSAGVPRAKVLKELQRGKDYPGMDTGIRAALTALLSWSERLLLANAGSQPVPATHVWKLGSRLGRKGYAVQVVGSVILGPILTLMSGSMVEQIFFGLLFVGLLGSATLRRLHDIGRGIPMMIIFVMLIPFLHFLPLVLLLLPGEPLPNRYGVPPVNQPQDNLQGGLQAALRRLNGQ